MPLQSDVPEGWRPDHKAVAYTVPLRSFPPTFYGACLHGDFTSRVERDTKDEALQDVDGHLLEVGS